ncbi:MAG: flagellar hook-length control protein FliK, partial [Epsilonproteobacteria bacterium]|nr:flagellar hook-length control protein FliK [Campylobacterota bacterium]
EKEEIPKAVPLKTEPLKTKQSKTKLTNIEVPKDNIIKETPKKETPTAVLPKTELLKTDTQSIKLFNEPLDNTKTQHILQQVIHPKEVKTQAKETKQNTDDMLKSLLSDKSIISPDLTHKSMSSIPDVKQDVFKSLESLLQGDTKDETTNIKSDILNVNKADSFEVKLNEAKQMIRYISQDIKHSIDEYKSPFTRVKLQLNPQKLGDVELTIVQRGKNLHINLSSNNVAINSLALNSNELKVQLQNSGINNATLNFSNSSQSSDSSFSGGQQSFHHENKAKDEYNYFEKEEKNEEVISSLEIIVPHYA